MADETIDDLTAPERLALLLPLALALWGWAVLTLFYAGLPVSRGTALLTLALGGAAAWRLGLLRWLGRWDRATMQRAWPLAALVLLWAAVLALRPPDHWLIQYDGAAHLLQARALIDGNYLPPESGFDAYHKYAFYRPPLLPALLAIHLAFLPSVTPYAVPSLVMLLFAWQVYLLALSLARDRFVAFIAAAVALTSPLVLKWGPPFYHDLLGATLLVTILNLYLPLGARDRGSRWQLVAVGAVGGLALLTKYSYGYLVGLAGWELLRSRCWRTPGWVVMGFALVALPFLIFNWHHFGDALYTIRFSGTPATGRAMDTTSGIAKSLSLFDPLFFWYERAQIMSGAVALLALTGVVWLARHRPVALGHIAAVLVPHLVIYLLLIGFGDRRYILPVVAVAPPLAACGLLAGGRWLRARSAVRRGWERGRAWLATTAWGRRVPPGAGELLWRRGPALLCALLMVASALPVTASWWGASEEVHDRALFHDGVLVTAAKSLRGGEGVVMSGKQNEVAWFSGRPTVRNPPTLSQVYDELRGQHVSQLVTQRYRGHGAWGNHLETVLMLPYLTPAHSFRNGENWAVVWDVDTSAPEEPMVPAIEPFIEVVTYKYNPGEVYFMRSGLMVLRYTAEEVVLDPALGNASALVLDWLVVRFDAYPGAVLDYLTGDVDRDDPDDRFYAWNYDGARGARSGPWVAEGGPPANLSAPTTLKPRDYGVSGAAGMHVLWLREVH